MSFTERTRPDLRQIARVLRAEQTVFAKPRDLISILFKESGRPPLIYEAEDFETIQALVMGPQSRPTFVLNPNLTYGEEADLLAHIVGHVLLGHLGRFGIILESTITVHRKSKGAQQEREAEYMKNLILYAPDTKLKIFSSMPNRLLQVAARKQFWR